jgi:hypothetical protein
MTTFYKIINLNSLILFHSIHSKIYRLEIWRCQTQKEISLPIEEGLGAQSTSSLHPAPGHRHRTGEDRAGEESLTRRRYLKDTKMA